MLGLKRILLLLVVFIGIFSIDPGSVSAKSTKQYDGVPSTLINKYWEVKDGFKGHSEYFYGSKSSYFGKHTNLGNFKSGWITYIKVKELGTYVMSGMDPVNSSKVIWWFIKPIQKWKKIRIGFVEVPLNDVPKHTPNYYMKDVATRVTKVTAIPIVLVKP